MCIPEMGHLIAIAYERVCIDLTRYVSRKHVFHCALLHFKISNDRIMCIFSKMWNFVQVYVKPECAIPLASQSELPINKGS